ncbi:MAG: hypothetical protein LAQ30_22090 [Acidobacteriia bacterium]|nr:hypothetical protein [Terriglobia bacterium]
MARLLFLCMLAFAAFGQRVTVSLNGTWDIEDSLAPDTLPASYSHKVPVPGLAHLATPGFPDVDRFDSVLNINRKLSQKVIAQRPQLTNSLGMVEQNRNWFWYRTAFRAPAKRDVAALKVGKAQFGTAVWLNGKKAGEHLGCFTAGYFNLTDLIQWGAENELVIRVGAHPAALPETAPAGTDQEKNRWTPGIYDAVSLLAFDNPGIESVQVAPRPADSTIQIQTVVRNYGPARTVRLTQRVKEGGTAAATVRLGAGETQTVLQTMAVPNARLWTPEQPNLYTLATSTGGDSISTRFGMREFRFDTATKRAYLNGKIYFLRGSNITLHRFFEDPASRDLVWNEKWVRKLLIEIPRRLNWNAFRFCIGPVPDFWLDIADEAGLLIDNEFFVWQWRSQWDMGEMTAQYREWMRDNWNHPSVAIWDAQNETRADAISEIIAKVRGLDLSKRPWENGYNEPVGPDDPVEDHPYLFSRVGRGFEPADLERMTGGKSTNAAHPTAHAAYVNEYGWLWLNRDGSPTVITRDVWERLLGPNSTADQRFAADAYYVGGLTEFWRAHRNYAGILHFVYLTASYPGACTSDHWRDLEKLELEPRFEDYISNAFRPLGVYLNFWQPTLRAGARRRFAVMLVNDRPEAAGGALTLTLESASGTAVLREEKTYDIPGLGAHTYEFEVAVPACSGDCMLRATARPASGPPTVSRRKVKVE